MEIYDYDQLAMKARKYFYLPNFIENLINGDKLHIHVIRIFAQSRKTILNRFKFVSKSN